VRFLLALLLPFVVFFTIGRPIAGIICLILQITLFGWLPAAIWAVYALGQYKTDKKIKKVLAQSSATNAETKLAAKLMPGRSAELSRKEIVLGLIFGIGVIGWLGTPKTPQLPESTVSVPNQEVVAQPDAPKPLNYSLPIYTSRGAPVCPISILVQVKEGKGLKAAYDAAISFWGRSEAIEKAGCEEWQSGIRLYIDESQKDHLWQEASSAPVNEGMKIGDMVLVLSAWLTNNAHEDDVALESKITTSSSTTPSSNDKHQEQDELEQNKTENTLSADTPQMMVIRMLDYALVDGGLSHESEIQQAKLQIESSPKPIKGNKKAARAINDKGLASSKDYDFNNAVKMFEEANKLDQSDVEIISNLGFAYLKQGDFNLAQQTLITVLTMSPGRAIAWASLGEVFGKIGDVNRAAACFSNTYRFSKDRLKTHQSMKKLNETEDVGDIKQARTKAINWAEKSYPDISENTELKERVATEDQDIKN
jgi:Flp pilus assembly protein TadD